MSRPFEACDLALEDLSLMYFSDMENPTPWSGRLNVALLDFSTQSLDHVNSYLDFVRTQDDIESVWNIVCLRAGAYLGEVIRRNGYSDRWHWLDYDNACKASPKSFASYAKSISTCAVLHQGGESFCFPLGKISKYLSNGSEDNTRFFAEVIIAKWKESEPE